MTHSHEEVAPPQVSEARLILRALLRSLTEVRDQRLASAAGLPSERIYIQGQIEGLNIAIAAIVRRLG